MRDGSSDRRNHRAGVNFSLQFHNRVHLEASIIEASAFMFI